MANIALIIAGGSGARMHQNIPKQFLTVNEKPVIVYTLEAFQNHADIDAISVVCIEGWESVLMAYANQFNITKLISIVTGGKNGQDSIRNGVFELEKRYTSDDIVLIHDAIRPMVSAEIISDCIVKTQLYGCGMRGSYDDHRGWRHLYRKLSPRSTEADPDSSGLSFRRNLQPAPKGSGGWHYQFGRLLHAYD